MMTRNKKHLVVEDEDRVALEKQIVVKDGTEKKKKEVTNMTGQESEKPIMVEEKEINDQEKEIEVEKEKENEEKEKVEKNKEGKEKSRSEKAREKKKEKASNEATEVPYPVVPSKKDKDCHLARFLEIFRKLEITMPFGEALQ